MVLSLKAYNKAKVWKTTFTKQSLFSHKKVIIVFIKYRNINNAKVGEVYEKVNGEYVYNSEITIQLKEII